MAQTDSRAGFRLPWSSERSNDPNETQPSDAGATAETDMDNAHAETRAESGDASTETALTGLGWTPSPVAEEAPGGHADWSGGGSSRKPSKFLADLTKAMQAAAEEARGLSLTQFQAEAKLHVEKIHERSATEAAGLRRAADDDVAAVREWSKAEIARIREETETRITARKGRLETEIEDHTALIEREIGAVQRRVAAFEQEMAEFFERLLAEDDPTRFATMAERLPEPPPFEAITADSYEPAAVEPEVEVEDTAAHEGDPVGAVETVADDAATDTASAEADTTSGEAETGPYDADGAHEMTLSGAPADFEVDREAAFAAIQAAAEAAASAEVAADAADRAEAVADIAIEIVGAHDDGDADAHRSTDFDAAEAEAEATADATGEVEEIPVIGDDALAARLADLLPGSQGGKDGAQESATTHVVVVGLVSVASIASFKRHLGRLTGVQSVGVSSGPDGEFVFAVHHAPEVVLRDAIPSMPSFQARVTGSGDGTLNVTAHDPESDS
ncbi:MAG TPA: hypothetical protein VK871_13765 [Candidatus Limnocylindrales bacterium]|nr:hypothetical protein [Candidatus Limnocylindrales bacterium]